MVTIKGLFSWLNMQRTRRKRWYHIKKLLTLSTRSYSKISWILHSRRLKTLSYDICTFLDKWSFSSLSDEFNICSSCTDLSREWFLLLNVITSRSRVLTFFSRTFFSTRHLCNWVQSSSLVPILVSRPLMFMQSAFVYTSKHADVSLFPVFDISLPIVIRSLCVVIFKSINCLRKAKTSVHNWVTLACEVSGCPDKLSCSFSFQSLFSCVHCFDNCSKSTFCNNLITKL